MIMCFFFLNGPKPKNARSLTKAEQNENYALKQSEEKKSERKDKVKTNMRSLRAKERKEEIEQELTDYSRAGRPTHIIP